MLRDLLAALLILSILGAVVFGGVTGLLHILLVVLAGFLSVFLVRRRPSSRRRWPEIRHDP